METQTFTNLIEFAEQLAEEWRLEIEADMLPTFEQLMKAPTPDLKKLARSGVSEQQFGRLGGKHSYYLENMSKLKKSEIATGIIEVWSEIIEDRRNKRQLRRKTEYACCKYDNPVIIK